MKQFYSILIAFTCVLLLSSNAISQTWTPVADGSDWYFINGVTMETRDTVFQIAKTTDIINLEDKSAKDKAWEAKPWYNYQVYGKKVYTEDLPPSADDFSINWKAVWNDESVYFLARVKDDNIIYDDKVNIFWGQDGFEFYFLPSEDISTSLQDNGQIARDDSTKIIFHVIMADFDGNPVKLAHPAGGADGASTPTEDGWRFAGKQTQVRYCTAQSFMEDGFLYYEWKVNNIADLPCAGDKTKYAVGDVLRAELKYNEADDIEVGNRKIMAQIAAYGGEAKTVSNTFPYLKLVDEVTGSSVIDLAKANVTAYPNPFSNQLTIKAKNFISDIAVYNMAGQIMKQFSGVENNTTTIDLNNLKNGIYYINVKDTKGTATIFKAIKR